MIAQESAVASLWLVSPRAVIAAPHNFFYFFKMKNFAIFSLLYTKLNSSKKIPDDFF